MQLKTTKRAIKKLHVHHTWQPNASSFTGSNHKAILEGIRRYHKDFNGWSDIGYHFLIFPDGAILVGRPLDSTPASASGFNTGAIAVSCIGDYDTGKDKMTPQMLVALVYILTVLKKNHDLTVDDVLYHHWMNNGKSCPGSGFLNVGNTKEAYNSSLRKLLINNQNVI